MIVLCVADGSFDLDGCAASGRRKRACRRPRHHARHRRPERTAWGVLSETLGDHRRLSAALIGLVVLTACLVILVRCDPALWLQVVTAIGHAVADRR